MSKNLKAYIWALILWIINIKFFFIASSYNQILQIFKASKGVDDFYINTWVYFWNLILVVPLFTLFLSIIFCIMLFYFWLIYFKVFFHRIPGAKNAHTGFWGVISSIVAFLGFGCIACGETLLTSILLFFVSSGSTLLIHTIGNLAIIIGIVVLYFGIRKNKKIFRNKNICKI